MSQLFQLRAAVINILASALPVFEVEPHLGVFDVEGIRTFSAKAPAIRVAVLGLLEPKPTGGVETDYVARLGIYVVTKDGTARMDRDTAAIAAVETISRLCQRGRWGLNFTLPGARAAASNLHSKEALGEGKALWAIDLRQPVRLHSPAAEEAIALEQLWIGFAPNVGAAHLADYLGPITGGTPDV